MVTESMCSFEVAKLLRQIGFDEPCHWYYDTNTEDKDQEYVLRFWSNGVKVRNSEMLDNEFGCCTHQMAIKYLREVKKYHIEIRFTDISWSKEMCFPRYYGVVYNLTNGRWTWESTLIQECITGFKDYEAATDFTLLRFIQEMIKEEEQNKNKHGQKTGTYRRGNRLK